MATTENYADTGDFEALEAGADGTLAARGFFDELAAQFGNAPWWLTSGIFHGLLLLLIYLVGALVLNLHRGETVIVTGLEENVPPEELKPEKTSPRPKPQLNISAPIIEPQPVFTHDEQALETPQTPDEVETSEARGDPDNYSDVPLGGPGTNGAIGLGSGKGGVFGRPGPGGHGVGRRFGMTPGSENAVNRALAWLARHQEPDGHWDAKKYEARFKTDTACTGLALLAFLGAGYSERVGKYKGNVRRAVAWLIAHQAANGLIFDTTDAGGHRGVGYPHAIAGMALAEAAGMGRVPATRAAAQKAVDYSVEIHQQGTGSEKGGWRYKAKSAPDLSVTGWFVMQLKSARMAKLQVPNFAFEGAMRFVDSVEVKGAGGDDAYESGHRYAYRPGRRPTHRVTAIGVLCRLFYGTDPASTRGGVKWFTEKGGLPAWGGAGNSVDLYYWYYGALCVFQQDAPKGPMWKSWNKAMQKALVENQRRGGPEVDGSWDAVGAFSAEWGRVGQTALATLCLEVYYRYKLLRH